MNNPERAEHLPLRPNLAFANSTYEREFGKHYHAFYYRYAQVSLALGLVLIFADFAVDYLSFRSGGANLYRLELCLPLLGVGIASSFSPYARRHWQAVMATFIVLLAISLFWVLLVIDRQGGMGLRSWVGLLNFVFLEFYCFVILGVQFRYALAAGISILLAFETAISIEAGVDRLMFFYWSYHTITLFLLAGAVGWWREFILRKEFAVQTSLHDVKNRLHAHNLTLEREVERRTRGLQNTQNAAIALLASVMETRDNETGNHVRRTQHYVRILATQLQSHPAYAAYLSDNQVDVLFKSAPLHDIGKVGIPDSILLKPGKLDVEEFAIMQTHARLGYEAIENAELSLGFEVEFLACAKEIALSHHERWDGSGYPQKLAGQDIPISARIMALADVYDALTSHRVYKDPVSHGAAVTIILEGRGKHFDPNVVRAFLDTADAFEVIANEFTDAVLNAEAGSPRGGKAAVDRMSALCLSPAGASQS